MFKQLSNCLTPLKCHWVNSASWEGESLIYQIKNDFMKIIHLYNQLKKLFCIDKFKSIFAIFQTQLMYAGFFFNKITKQFIHTVIFAVLSCLSYFFIYFLNVSDIFYSSYIFSNYSYMWQNWGAVWWPAMGFYLQCKSVWLFIAN